MPILYRRTIGTTLLAYADSDPTGEATPAGSLISTGTGQLFISQGGGAYVESGSGGSSTTTAASYFALDSTGLDEGTLGLTPDGVYQLKQYTHPIDGNVLRWVPRSVAEDPSWSLVNYYEGTESAADLTARGWSLSTTTPSLTITNVDNLLRFTATNTNGSLYASPASVVSASEYIVIMCARLDHAPISSQWTGFDFQLRPTENFFWRYVIGNSNAVPARAYTANSANPPVPVAASYIDPLLEEIAGTRYGVNPLPTTAGTPEMMIFRVSSYFSTIGGLRSAGLVTGGESRKWSAGSMMQSGALSNYMGWGLIAPGPGSIAILDTGKVTVLRRNASLT